MQPGEETLKAHQKALLALLEEFDRVCRQLEIPYVLFAGTLLGAVRHKGFIPWDDDLDVMMLREDYERFLQEADAVVDQQHFFLQKEFSAHWPMFFSKLRMNGTACLEKFHPKDPEMHQGIYMDIFPCDRAAGNEFGRRLQFLASKVVIAKSLDARGYATDSVRKKIFMFLCQALPGSLFHRAVRGPKKTGGYVHSFLGGASRYTKSVFPASWFEEQVRLPFEDGEYSVPAGYDALLKTLYGDYMKIPSEEDRKCKQHAILVDLNHSYEEYAHYRDGMKFDTYTRSIR